MRFLNFNQLIGSYNNDSYVTADFMNPSYALALMNPAMICAYSFTHAAANLLVLW